jgi:hypothetical protein
MANEMQAKISTNKLFLKNKIFKKIFKKKTPQAMLPKMRK